MSDYLKRLRALLPSTVNVVGNAQSIFDKQDGQIIDKHPTIRFNRIQVESTTSQGTRWDFLASSEIKTFEMYNSIKPGFHTLLFTPYLDEQICHKNVIEFETNIFDMDIKISKRLMNEIGYKPSTGLQILTYLSMTDIHVNIFGFDWKKTPTIYDPTRVHDPHNYTIERTHALELINKQNWNIY
jgi:hypothetical protein